jgi:hypothetical protein
MPFVEYSAVDLADYFLQEHESTSAVGLGVSGLTFMLYCE